MDNKVVNQGVFYVVATPIGHLDDISQRALQVLQQVDVILAEDTRHSAKLLRHYGINTKTKACHDHNEANLLAWVHDQLDAGNSLALISDAGTPLISDPGYVLVKSLQGAAQQVVPVPGACSIIAALSAAGLPTDRFRFEGFLPAKAAARQTALASFADCDTTVVLLESSHRIMATLADMTNVLSAEHEICLAREISKHYEQFLHGTAVSIRQQLAVNPEFQRGEFVLMLAPAPKRNQTSAEWQIERNLLQALLPEMPVQKAVQITMSVSDKRKNELYALAVELKNAE